MLKPQCCITVKPWDMKCNSIFSVVHKILSGVIPEIKATDNFFGWCWFLKT